ncbi:MAG: type VI secretion system ImpA family N-terminal domain-containing protein [Paracoccus sp. (in: a-proteobacteria)]|nr:type VI secretion system ImpA family N-terminal domain-containing protein [Paracoccus sp. (in: a-proteobacteria)]
MTDDWLLTPITEEAPCGPDLEAAGDDAFIDYYYEAESRLPERYFTPGQAADGSADRLFDPKSVAISKEAAAIHGLLHRSRDLRLLALLARFQILAGRLADFADTLESMVGAMERWPRDLHPLKERRSTIEVLNEQPTVAMPLQHLQLIPNSGVTLRRWLVATGRLAPRASEEDLGGTDVLAPLRGDGQAKTVAQVQALLSRVAAALAGLERHGAGDSAATPPDLGAARQVVADMQALIAEARPDLRPWNPVSEPEAAPVISKTEPAAPALVTAAGTIGIPNRTAARTALTSAEAWLVAEEPSSPALMLVTQARLLIGLSLVEAIEALMPAQAGQAVLAIGHGSAFTLPMARMKELTAAPRDIQPADPPADGSSPVIRSRANLESVLASVGAFYTKNEPASPIPLLLMRARDLSGRDFSALMGELFAAPPSGKEH